MYFIYDYKNAILHFSYCNRDETNESRGVYGIQQNNYNNRKDFFYYSLEIKLKNHIKIPDVRFYIENRILNNIMNCIFILIQYIINLFDFMRKKYKKISNKNIIILKFTFLIICILSFSFHFLIGGFYEESQSVEKKLIVSLSEWKDIIHQMPLSMQIEVNQNSYFEGKIPNIKGIHDFRLISLGNHLKNENTIERYLAVPFKKIISLKNDDSIQYIDPYNTCMGKDATEYSIFNISWNDKILIFNEEFHYSKNLINNFILVPKSHILSFINRQKIKNICDYMVLN